MKAILIDPATRTCSEVEYDGWSLSGLTDLLQTDTYGSRMVRPGEIIMFDDEGRLDATLGFTLPLPGGSVKSMGRAIIVGSVAGRMQDTQLTPLHVERGLYWHGVDHVVS